MIDDITKLIGNEHLDVYIELNNFLNPRATNMWFYEYGVLRGVCPEHWFFKTFNANEWHKLIGIKNGTPRDICKQQSIKYAGIKGFITDDDNQADAFNIAYLGDLCLETSERAEYTKKKKLTKMQQLKAEVRELKKQRTASRHLEQKLNKKLNKYERKY